MSVGAEIEKIVEKIRGKWLRLKPLPGSPAPVAISPVAASSSASSTSMSLRSKTVVPSFPCCAAMWRLIFPFLLEDVPQREQANLLSFFSSDTASTYFFNSPWSEKKHNFEYQIFRIKSKAMEKILTFACIPDWFVVCFNNTESNFLFMLRTKVNLKAVFRGACCIAFGAGIAVHCWCVR